MRHLRGRMQRAHKCMHFKWISELSEYGPRTQAKPAQKRIFAFEKTASTKIHTQKISLTIDQKFKITKIIFSFVLVNGDTEVHELDIIVFK